MQKEKNIKRKLLIVALLVWFGCRAASKINVTPSPARQTDTAVQQERMPDGWNDE